MAAKKRNKRARRVQEQVVVYVDAQDRELLERMTAETGLARTELFRRGLRRLADEMLAEQKPWSSFDQLVGALDGADVPSDLSVRHDEYLYRGYERLQTTRKKRARPG